MIFKFREAQFGNDHKYYCHEICENGLHEHWHTYYNNCFKIMFSLDYLKVNHEINLMITIFENVMFGYPISEVIP